MKIKIEIDAITQREYGTLIVEAPDISHVKSMPEDDLAELIPEKFRCTECCTPDGDTTYKVVRIGPLDPAEHETVDVYVVNGLVLSEWAYRKHEVAEQCRKDAATRQGQLVSPCCSEK